MEAGVGGRCSRDDERCARLRRCAEALSAVLNGKSPNSCHASRSSNGAEMKSIINALKKEGKPQLFSPGPTLRSREVWRKIRS